MPRALLVCSTIVAAFQLQLAAASTLVEEAPIPASVAALAERAEIDPRRDRTRFMVDLAQAIYASADSRPSVLTDSRPVAVPRAAGDTPLTVLIPLSSGLWSAAVFGRVVPPDQLVAAIVGDRRAMLLCRGLSGLDDDTLSYFAEHPAVLTNLYERGAGLFAAFGPALRVRGGRVVPPGGPDFEPLWQTIAEVPLDRPDRFIRRAYAEGDDRIPYLMDTLDAAPPAAVRFVLGAWMPERTRIERFKALFETASHVYREWHPEEHPFSRPLGDLAMLLVRVKLDDRGALQPPASRGFWAEVFGASAGGAPTEPVDAAWLMSVIGEETMYARMDRLDQFAFAQRVFSTIDQALPPMAVDVIRALARHRMLLLSLERMGVRAPDVYQSAIQRAGSLRDLGDAHRFWTVAQFQGALAFVVRLRRMDVISEAQVSPLVMSLFAVPLRDDVYGAAMVDWWRTRIGPLLPAGDSWEQRTIAAASGRAPIERRRLLWEGQLYAVDLPFAERRRMTAVRVKQGGLTLDIALEVDDLARRLRGAATLADVRAAEQVLRTMMVESADRLRRPVVQILPAGVPPPRDALEWVGEEVRSLARIVRASDLRRAAGVGASLQGLAERAFAESLLTLIYAAELGDPDGAAMLGGNVALRHDFGFGRNDTEGRLKALWGMPRQEFQPGVPWHINGSLLGLDLGLAPLNLRRVSIDRVADMPKLPSIERESLATSVALLDPQRLTDVDRDRLAEAVIRGRQKVEAAAADRQALEQVAADLGLSGYRRRSLREAWQARPASIAELFTVNELLTLGGAALHDLDAWGPPGLYSIGCLCTSYSTSRAWRALEGRIQLPVMTATMGDLNLTMAMMLRELNVPITLLKGVLAIAMQDLIDGLGDRGDWWGLSEAAKAIKRQKVEDYVSAAAAVDGPLVPIDETRPAN